MSRGLWLATSARTRRTIVLLWTALFLCSIAMQSVQLAVPTPVLAVHDDGLFEMDGNALNGGAAGDDWEAVFDGTDSAFDTRFIIDPVDDNADKTFTGGSTKDDLNITNWLWKNAKASQAKNDITHAFAAAYTAENGDTLAYFGLNKWEADGNNFVGFWFLNQTVAPTGSGNAPGSPFTGAHSVGDILVLASYTNGGALADFDVYKWVGSGGNVNGTLQSVASGVPCTGAPVEDFACGATNGSTIDSPWPFTGRDGEPGEFPPGTFFEGGINLTELGLDTGCFSTFIAETRSSQSVDATLSDFANGQFSFCVPPEIETNSSVATADFGQEVTDTATVGGSKGPGTGDIDFFLCGPTEITAAGCPTGGTAMGANVPLVDGSATSSAYTVGLTAAAVGTYCWRAEYDPAAGSKYLAAEHTNATTECFTVAPATIVIDKVANPAGPVNAGATIGFDLVITNTGTGTALGVSVSDNLPAGNAPSYIDWTLGTVTGGASCEINGAVGSEVLTCTKATLASKASFSVRVTAQTDSTDCATYDNTGSVQTTNDGSDTDPASVVVNCPDVNVVKTPNDGQFNAGDPASFSIVVTNAGPGIATNVSLSDPLPGGLTWTLGTVSGADAANVTCGVTGAIGAQTLTCSDASMAAGETFTVTVTTTTSSATCAVFPNVATVDAINEPNTDAYTDDNTDPGAITVNCPDVQALKTAGASPVNAGDAITFTVTIKNNGAGTAYGATGSDLLPAGIDWAIVGDADGWSIVAGSLVFGPADLAAGETHTVTISGVTDAADCGVVPNTVNVDATNESNDASITDDNSASAQVTVDCPDVEAEKTADESPVNAGDEIGFTVTITNNGTGTAYGATGSDTLPAGIDWAIDGDGDGWSIVNGVLSFGPADLAPGESHSVHIVGVTDAADCGIVPNTVTVDATNESNDASITDDNSASAQVTVNCPDLNVEKDAVDGTISAGEDAEFTIVISNVGDGVAYDVSVDDDLPAGPAWDLVSVAFDGTAVADPDALCQIVGVTLTCADLGDLAPGDEIEITISADTDFADCGNLLNVVTVDASNESNDGQFILNNTDTATVQVDCPDLGIDKDADHADPVLIGEQIGFRVTIVNNGDGTAFGVTVSDTLDADFDWSIESADAGWTLVGNVLSFNGNLAGNGGLSSVHVVASTSVDDAADQCGLVPNTAVLDHSSIDPTEASADEAVRCPDVDIEKEADDDLVEPNQTVAYTLSVVVLDGPVSNAVITDDLPVGQTYVAGSAESDGVADEPTVSPDGRTLTWEFASLDAGDPTLVITYDVTIDADATGAGQLNTAEICVDEPTPCEEAVELVTPQLPEIELIKTAGDAADGEVLETPAGDVTYTYVVTNDGPLTLLNVTVTDDAGTPGDTSDDFEADCPATTLAPDESMTCTFTVEVLVDTTNVAVASGVTEGGNPVEDDDPAEVVILEFGLLIDKVNDAPLETLELPDGTLVDLPTADEGDTVTYTLAYDLLADPVTLAVIEDELPVGVTYVDGSATNDAQFTFQGYDEATRTLTWTAPSVTVDGTLSYDATVDEGAAELSQPLLNVAVIDSEETDPDDGDSEVFVPTIPLEETSPPTLPPTDTFDGSQAPGNPGFSLMLILLAMGSLMLVIGFVTPVPASVRERSRR